MMRIVIDLQGAQSGSRFHGIGRYSLSIVQAIARNRGEHEVFIALNGLFPETIEPIRAAFDGLLPQENIRIWYAPGPVRESQPGNEIRRAAAERIREAFLASLEPDVILVTSLFEGFSDDAVTSIRIFDKKTPVAVILYDLIPLLNPDKYLSNSAIKQYYLKKLEHLKKADAWLALSVSSAKDGHNFLGLREDCLFNISAACDERFRSLEISNKQKSDLFNKYKIIRPFLLCVPSGIDPRKNLERLVQAYSTLSDDMRKDHQLVIASAVNSDGKQFLERIAQNANLNDDELVITGYVTEEELVMLYNLCRLFVYPSMYEGFGLPPLEAMACGAPVIVSNTSSLNEVVGREDMLFDPLSVESIAKKIDEVLKNDDFRKDLVRHGLQQAKRFSWDESAKRAMYSLKKCLSQNKSMKESYQPNSRPLLAYISPLPPECSGISDYSAELLPELARYYDIEVIVNPQNKSDYRIGACLPIRSVEYFKNNADRYERVLYHIGNSMFHVHMLDLLDEFPGVTVLHDFYLGNLKAHLELSRIRLGIWTHALYESHGYKAVFERLHDRDLEKTIFRYPCNFDVIRKSLGIIVHSSYALGLALKWYEDKEDWVIVPQVFAPPKEIDRKAARNRLGIPHDTFLVCSFGILGPTKQNHRLLDTWIKSILSRDSRCQLVFVGENHGGEYGHNLLKIIREKGLQERVRITGWVDKATFRSYLEATDVAVQLRILSRGETSRSILECMSYGIPLIINAHGSSAEMPPDAVYMLPDDFKDDELAEALETLWCNRELRESLSKRACEVIYLNHTPSSCAKRYYEVIEKFYERSRTGTKALIDAIANVKGIPSDDRYITSLARCIATSLPRKHPARQILVDVSRIMPIDEGTGIQRVVRSILKFLLLNPPEGYRVEPIYASTTHGYRYARSFTMSFLRCPFQDLQDEPVEYQTGDIFFGLGLDQSVMVEQGEYLESLRNAGVRMFFVVYDIIPIQMPEAFSPEGGYLHSKWLSKICRFSDGILCISKAVADDVVKWLKRNGLERRCPLKIGWFHISADIENSSPTKGLPENASEVLNQIRSRISFLMVGRVEPRKGHAQVLAAFEQLWRDGLNVNLVIVGRRGWMVEGLIGTLSHHPELGKRLFWLEGISDEYLERIYGSCKCLISASLAEGFGLPLIEAAQHEVPIIARDLPVFREVAEDHAFYFKGDDPSDLAEAIKEWLALFKEGRHPKSEGMRWLTWEESAKDLLDIILKNRWYVIYDSSKTAK